MPNFRARFFAGVSVAPWDDPSSLSLQRPTRLNPSPGHPFLREVCTVGVEVELQAHITGLGWAPLDAAFAPDPVFFPLEIFEYPGPIRPVTSHPVDQTSVQRFTPDTPGHYTLRFYRPQGGAIYLHLDAQVAP